VWTWRRSLRNRHERHRDPVLRVNGQDRGGGGAGEKGRFEKVLAETLPSSAHHPAEILEIRSLNGATLLAEDIAALKTAWKATLDF
jgi:hypothetical protein